MKRRFIYPFTPTWIDYPDNESIAISVYMMGCNHRCYDCSNPDFIDENYSFGTKDFTIHKVYRELDKLCLRNKTNKIVFLGGDPIYRDNLEFIRNFLKDYSNVFEVCIYTGYSIDFIKDSNLKGFRFIKCGCFERDNKIVSEKTDEYLQFASTNQKLYDMNYNLLSDNGRYYFPKEVA